MLRQFLGLCPQPSSGRRKKGLHLGQNPGDLFLLIIASTGCSFTILEGGKSYETKIKIVKSPRSMVAVMAKEYHYDQEVPE